MQHELGMVFYDNAATESFFHTIKVEFVHDENY